MIETPAPDSGAVVRRYAPPNQRNRPLSRRKSGGDRTGNPPYYFGPGEEKTTASSVKIDHPEAATSSSLITIPGCCRSEAAQLLTDRWVAAVNYYNDPSIDLSERPVMYSGAGAPAWGHSRLSHQMDFLTELRRAMLNANASLDA